MKTFLLSLFLPFAFFLSFSGCAAEQGDSLPPVGGGEPSSEQAAGEDVQLPEEESEKAEAEAPPAVPVDAETEKYYDYFAENAHISFLLTSENGKDGFSDDQMAAYVLSELISLSGGSYDCAVGFPREVFDAVTEKYFGTAIRQYENTKSTVVPETGNITATGWGGSSLALVLKELETGPDGIRTGVFYLFGFSMDEFYPGLRDDLLQGMFDGYGQPSLVTIVFEEKTDENGEMYLRYHNTEPGGEAAAPYHPYRG